MNSLVRISLLLLAFFQRVDGDIVLLNDPSGSSYPPYTLVSPNNRDKRQDPSWLQLTTNLTSSLELDKFVHDQCNEHSYTKLYSCSHLADCTSLSSCLESIHCPPNVQSYGSLIVHLLYLLGSNHCHNNSDDTSCSHEQRSIILHNLLTHWTDSRVNPHGDHDRGSGAEVDSYCKTIPDFIYEVEEEIRAQCTVYSRQVEAFLENYRCSARHAMPPSTSTLSPPDFHPSSHLAEALKHLDPSASDVDYEDEKDFNFLNSNKNLLNTTEQTVYVNDHQYYNVSYIVPRFGDISMNYIPDNLNQFIPIGMLADRHRSAYSINLTFNFPFYGHTINRILIGTGGFIYTGDLLHSYLIGSTQYIAPFMGNFDVSIGGNRSNIKYFDNTTHFICTWNNLYLQDQQEAGPFTFQAILQNTGTIYFNYLRIPPVKILTVNHAHRIGLSDAYMSQHVSSEHTVRVITLYDKINLDKEKIQDGVSIILTMDNTCNTFTDCSSCLANRGKRYNCSWCDDIQKCSDGYDRSRHQWVRAQCHRLASENICPTHVDDLFEKNHFIASSPIVHFDDMGRHSASESHSTMNTLRTIVITLLLTVLILSLVAFLVTYTYAYRHPTSPPGMWLIEHRPSNYIARFKRFSDRNNEST